MSVIHKCKTWLRHARRQAASVSANLLPPSTRNVAPSIHGLADTSQKYCSTFPNRSPRKFTAASITDDWTRPTGPASTRINVFDPRFRNRLSLSASLGQRCRRHLPIIEVIDDLALTNKPAGSERRYSKSSPRPGNTALGIFARW